MTNLATKQLYITQPVPVTQPQLQFTFPKPVSYEFRVAETVDDDGKVLNVKLQVQVWEHDEYGAGTVKQYWADVPRQKFTKDGVMLTPF